MEIKCAGCGNVFDDSLGFCPSCGRMVDKPTEPASFEEQTLDPTAQPAASQTDPQQNAYGADEQNTQASAQYQNQSYNYGSGQAQQPGYQSYQQPNYQHPGYQSYQQPNYQQQPGYQNYQQPYAATDPNAKSKLAAGLLGIFLGGLGVHNFYLGYTGKAIAQLLLSVLSCGILAAVSAIWGFIEGILILCGSTITTDASGRPLSD